LKRGTRLGPYEILSAIGAGGMGEVYKATDTNLKRSVAIKVLPAPMAGDADRLTRFQREAEVLAALNHPHIAAIYGLERSGTATALVMELVEGEDLSAIIARGPIPLAEALPMARQVADALEAAHELGIVHRDLKPANIKVRADRTVKVLDFGLAKALDPAGAGMTVEAANSPTLTVHGTRVGMIIGTAAYMAPEQAKGKTVDRRADIWAFAVVLYEMLTGQRAFKGEDVSDTLAAVLKDMPQFDALPAGTPPRLRELLARCLEKDPRQRQRDIGDVKLEIDAIAEGRSTVPSVGSTPVSRARPPLATVAGLVVAAAAVTAAIEWLVPRTSATAGTAITRFTIDSPTSDEPAGPALTPDGRILVFATDRLYKRDLSVFTVTPIPGTDGASTPMISPDGRWVAFFASGQLKKVSLSGGDATTIAEVNASMPGATWAPDNTILFSRGWSTGLSSVPVDGGQIRQLTEPDRKVGERGHWRPHLLPGGRQALFTIWMAGSGVNDARIGLLDLKSGQHRALFPGTNGTYLRSGHVLFFHAGVWHVVPFDAAGERTTGDPVTVLDDARGIDADGGDSAEPLSVSDNGNLTYRSAQLHPKQEFVWADRAGRIESLGLPAHMVVDAAIAPDGRLIAVSRMEGGTYELWMDDVARKTEDRLDIKGSNFKAIWNPRGSSFAFVSERKGDYDTYTANADGTNVQPLLTKDIDEQALAWTHDGRRLVEKEWHPDGSTPMNLIDLDAGGMHEGTRLVASTFGGDSSAELSRDDRWLLYNSVVAGRREVYVQPFPGQTAPIRVSSAGGERPFWSVAGSEILFQHDDHLVSVSFRQQGDRAVIGPETPLFPLPASSTLYGVAPDGRFLIGRLADPEEPPGIRVVLNWFEELKRPAVK
jgi:serine/threonine-protein kinase